ncbi:MAG: autotransporter outer membrane beta-barrel domain-containing protein, partial [Endomicrobium sp.]|nr:autotransporter outer membrane beta-barrel domain-containing protein [Endomicrobium sp.]
AEAIVGAIDLENTNIGVYVSSDVTLSPGDEFVLIRSTNGVTGKPKSISNIVQKGMASIFDCSVDMQETQVLVKLTRAEVCPALFQGYNASIALLNFGVDLAIDRGMQEITGASEFGKAGIVPFMVFSGKNGDYGSKSQVKVSGISMLAGVKVKEFEIKSRPLTMGIFCEYGNGKFDSKNDFNEVDIKSKGTASYVGGGLLGRTYFKDNVYCEVSLRIGQTKADYNSADLKDFGSDLKAKYDYSTLYFGSHLGCGYIHKFNDKLNADLYGKYMFLNQDTKEVVLPSEEKLKFFGANSQRVQLGARFNYLMSKHISLLLTAGAALEHEFDGQVKAAVDNAESINSNLKGNNVIGEIGLGKDFGKLNVDLGVQGYGGNKRDLQAQLKASYIF